MAFLTRTTCRGAPSCRASGVSLALPLLDSMIPAATALGQTAAGGARTRLGAIYFPHGAIMNKWTPPAVGAGFELSEILQPLKPFYDQVTVVSSLRHALAYGSGATANHNRSAAALPERRMSPSRAPRHCSASPWTRWPRAPSHRTPRSRRSS